MSIYNLEVWKKMQILVFFIGRVCIVVDHHQKLLPLSPDCEIDSSISGCKTSSLLDKILARWSTASYALVLAYRPFVFKKIVNVFPCQLIWVKMISLQSNLISTTPSIKRHMLLETKLLVQNSLFHTTTPLDNTTFRNSILSY